MYFRRLNAEVPVDAVRIYLMRIRLIMNPRRTKGLDQTSNAHFRCYGMLAWDPSPHALAGIRYHYHERPSNGGSTGEEHRVNAKRARAGQP